MFASQILCHLHMPVMYFFGKKYSVPADLTIMTAMEYAGYTLKRGCGCRHGFCGACATIYRIKGENELKTCLACQTQVQEGMYVASIPFFPTDKRTYNIEDLKPNQQVMMELYPEIYSCIGCNACTKACPQDLNVMQKDGEWQKASGFCMPVMAIVLIVVVIVIIVMVVFLLIRTRSKKAVGGVKGKAVKTAAAKKTATKTVKV